MESFRPLSLVTAALCVACCLAFSADAGAHDKYERDHGREKHAWWKLPCFWQEEDDWCRPRWCEPAEQNQEFWFRPRLFGLRKAQRCSPSTFTPRGYGDLFHRRFTDERMDYHRYVLYDPTNQYGPSYYCLPESDYCPWCKCLDRHFHDGRHPSDCD